MGGSSYRFRLERVRALRERREDEAKLELAAAMRQQQAAEQELTAARHQIVSARQAQQLTGTSNAADLIARQAYLERVESAHRSGLEDLRKHNEAVDGRRVALTEAAQERQALERLKAKGLAAHQREEERVANVALDEIATNGYRRRAA
jgi:flagellar protein FliJ